MDDPRVFTIALRDPRRNFIEVVAAGALRVRGWGDNGKHDELRGWMAERTSWGDVATWCGIRLVKRHWIRYKSVFRIHGAALFELIGWFVQHPLRILALGGLYVAAWGALRLALPARRTNALLAPAAYCVAFAAWEWLVTVRTPDANIRVDLLLIWPALLLLTLWSIWRALRPRA